METQQEKYLNQSSGNNLTFGLLGLATTALLFGLLLYAETFLRFWFGVGLLVISVLLIMFPIIFAGFFRGAAGTGTFAAIGGIFGLLVSWLVFWFLIKNTLVECLVESVKAILEVL